MSFLLNPTVLLLIALAAASGFGAWEKHRADAAVQQVEAAKQEIKALGVQISTQNAAIDGLKADGDRRVKAAADGLAAAQAAAGAAQRQAGTLREALKTATNLRGPAAGCAPSGADRAVAAIRANLK